MLTKKFSLLLTFCFVCCTVFAQNNKPFVDTFYYFETVKPVPADTVKPVVVDTSKKIAHDPRKATRRSAIIPGWGQAYNKEYWKIPIVYGALAVPTALFFYNNKWYKETRDAYSIVVNGETDRYDEIDPKLINPNTGLPLDANSLQLYRNQFRRDRDYSILFFAAVWGLNVVDATVFGHLKDFDVSDDLSMQVAPSFNPVTNTAGLGIALHFKNTPPKKLPAF